MYTLTIMIVVFLVDLIKGECKKLKQTKIFSQVKKKKKLCPPKKKAKVFFPIRFFLIRFKTFFFHESISKNQLVPVQMVTVVMFMERFLSRGSTTFRDQTLASCAYVIVVTRKVARRSCVHHRKIANPFRSETRAVNSSVSTTPWATAQSVTRTLVYEWWRPV